MIIRGGGAVGVTDFATTAPCVCATGGCAAGGALPAAAEVVVVVRGGTAIPGGGAVLVADETAEGGVDETFGGITTTVGGRYPAATEAGVTSLAAGGAVAGASITGLGGVARAGATGAAGTSFFASTAGVAVGDLTTGRATGCSAAPFCWMARSTSPGREIFDRSILVLISSSPRGMREVFAELGAASDRRRRCFRTSSASCSSRELECVFFSVTPTVVSTSRISLLLTSSSRARSLIRILLIRSRFLFLPISPI
jgi:hypothetical protein